MAGRRYTAVTYSNHARDQMRLRLIGEEQAERTIAAPTRSYPSTNPPGRIVAERVTTVGNTLRVVYVELPTAQGTVAHVVTVIRIRGRRR